MSFRSQTVSGPGSDHTIEIRRVDQGNVLFLILIAVVLFAALAFAVTQSSRSGGSDTDQEKMSLAWSEIENVVIAHRQALTRMILGGINPNSISFFAQPNLYVDNTDCTTDSCRVYAPGGGGLSYYKFHQLHPALTPAPNDDFGTASGPRGMWIANKGTERADFAYVIWVTEKFCNFINSRLGVSTLTSAMSPTAMGLWQINAGTFDIAGNYPFMYSFTTSEAPHLAGFDEGCFVNNQTPPRYFYFALLYAN